MNTIKIGTKIIGPSKPCFIVAEAGINHNGSLKIAKKMIDAAKSAGADAVKFQTFKTDDLVIPKTQMAEYQKNNLKKDTFQNEMLKKIELPFSAFRKLKKYCDQKNIIFLSNPHTESAINFLNALVPAYKISSGDLTNHILLKKIAKKKKPMILSTGMSTLSEIKDAVALIKESGNNKIILLHCTSNYPCPLEEVNLLAMDSMQKIFKLPVGFSDHTLGNLASLAATTLGATIIEKHFTLNKKMPGPDHKASLEPQELTTLIQLVRQVKTILGDAKKRPTKSEQRIKKFVRKSLVAAITIPKNTIITPRLLAVKRPGTGLPPKCLKQIIGKKAKQDILQNTLINFKQLS